MDEKYVQCTCTWTYVFELIAINAAGGSGNRSAPYCLTRRDFKNIGKSSSAAAAAEQARDDVYSNRTIEILVIVFGLAVGK